MSTSALALPGLPAQWKSLYSALSLKQRTIIAAAAMATLACLALFAHAMQSPKMAVLFEGMSPSESQKVVAALENHKIKSEVDAKGTVRVPSEQLEEARLAAVQSGPEQSGRIGFEIFDKPNWMGSEFDERVNYQRALEGELEHTIASIEQVESARVHIVMPEQSLYSDRDKPAKAAVVLKLRAQRLSANSADAIQNLIASAVPGLSPQNIQIMSADGRPLSGAGEEHSEQEAEAALERRVVATLERVAGEGRVTAAATIERDPSNSESTEEVFDPKTSVPLSTQRSEQHSGLAVVGGPAGTAANSPTSAVKPAAPAGKEQTSSSENSTYGVNRSVHHIVQPAGRIRRITVAVVVDEGQPARSKEEIAQLQSLAAAAAGIDPARGDVLKLESVSFAKIGGSAAPEIPGKLARFGTQLQHSAALVRIVAVVLLFAAVYALVLRPLTREARNSLRQVASVATVASLGAGSEGVKPEPTLAEWKRVALGQLEKRPEAAKKIVGQWLKQG